jgi:hypothetical protein
MRRRHPSKGASMNLHEFIAAKSQLEKRLRDLIEPELALFRKQTGVSVSSVSVDLYSIQKINGQIRTLVGNVTTTADLRTLSHATTFEKDD